MHSSEREEINASEKALSEHLKEGIGRGSQWAVAYTRGWYASQMGLNLYDFNPNKGKWFQDVYWDEGWWAYFHWKADYDESIKT